MLNPNSPVPLYHQLAEIILDKIRAGDYPPGSRIPSEHQLAATYGIGRPTARQAVDQLVRKQFLVRRRGSGTYVCERKEEVGLFSLDGTLSSFHRKGLPVDTRILEKARLIGPSGDPANPFSGGQAYFLSRLTRVDGAAVLIEDMYFHSGLFKGIDQIDLTGRSLSEIADERYFMRPTGGKQNFRIGYLNGRKARQLEVGTATPVLVVRRYLHFPQSDNAFFSELFCRTDRFVFSQTIGSNISSG
jgi:GntR family transcriptional regulator